MKFLVIARPKDNANITLEAATRAMAQNAELIDKGAMDLVYNFVNGGAVSIINTDTAEELWFILHQSALYQELDWQVEPLVDMQMVMDNIQMATHDAK